MQTKKLTLAQVNKAIAAKWPLIRLTKGKGYYYIYSDDKEMALKLAALYTTSIGVYNINQATLSSWLMYVEELLKDMDRLPSERNPAI